MDNLTHTLVGLVAAESGLARRYGSGTAFTLALASNLPDVDALWARFAGGDAFLYRRMATHSLFGVPVLALLSSMIIRLVWKGLRFRDLFVLHLVGMYLHTFFDLLNSYGVVLFYPLTRARWEMAWVFILDLALWGILVAPFLVALVPRFRIHREKVFRVALVSVAGYLLLCGGSRLVCTRLLDETLARRGEAASFTAVVPEAFGPHRFRGLALVGDDVWSLYLLHAWEGRAELVETFRTRAREPRIAALRETPRARELEWFFLAPVWTICDGGRSASVTDLRFRSAVLPRRRSPFDFQFELPPRKDGDPS